jgi:hypothetical protein
MTCNANHIFLTFPLVLHLCIKLTRCRSKTAESVARYVGLIKNYLWMTFAVLKQQKYAEIYPIEGSTKKDITRCPTMPDLQLHFYKQL